MKADCNCRARRKKLVQTSWRGSSPAKAEIKVQGLADSRWVGRATLYRENALSYIMHAGETQATSQAAWPMSEPFLLFVQGTARPISKPSHPLELQSPTFRTLSVDYISQLPYMTIRGSDHVLWPLSTPQSAPPSLNISQNHKSLWSLPWITCALSDKIKPSIYKHSKVHGTSIIPRLLAFWAVQAPG